MKKIVGSLALALLLSTAATAFAAKPMTCWFPPSWKAKPATAKRIVKALAQEAEMPIRPRIAKSYPEILRAFASDDQNLVYVGSFVQSILWARGLGEPLVQADNEKKFYSGIFIYPQDENPRQILKNAPEQIAYAVGASSGESSAKAATNGKAAIGVPNHSASVGAVLAGKAEGAVVKNWWWQANKDNYQGLEVYEIPGVSLKKNPDNVLTASRMVPQNVQEKIKAAAKAHSEAFGVKNMVEFKPSKLDFSLKLMKKGGIDPFNYTW